MVPRLLARSFRAEFWFWISSIRGFCPFFFYVKHHDDFHFEQQSHFVLFNSTKDDFCFQQGSLRLWMFFSHNYGALLKLLFQVGNIFWFTRRCKVSFTCSMIWIHTFMTRLFWTMIIQLGILFTLPKTYHLKIGRTSKGIYSNYPFSGANMLVSGRVFFGIQDGCSPNSLFLVPLIGGT